MYLFYENKKKYSIVIELLSLNGIELIYFHGCQHSFCVCTTFNRPCGIDVVVYSFGLGDGDVLCDEREDDGVNGIAYWLSLHGDDAGE